MAARPFGPAPAEAIASQTARPAITSAEAGRETDGFWRTVLIAWALAAIVLTLVSASRIALLAFPDPDDAMRLAEVRDLVAGQSWWDVGQHRLDGGAFQMHWSRLVDLPIAAVLLVADPVFGPAAGTRIAMVVVPMLTLLVVMALAAALARRVAGADTTAHAVLLAALSVPLVYQLQPLRIDHHGWQIAAALAATLALVTRRDARSGALAGVALATLVTISLEGLPVSAAIAAVALLAWALDPARRAQALAFVVALPLAAVALHVATRGPFSLTPACDAIAPAWLAAMTLACACAAAAILVSPRAVSLRIAGLAASGVAGALLLRAAAPVCLRGPFATLDPLVYRFWYSNVSEGLPIWQQIPAWAAMTVGLPLVGLLGGLLAWREGSGEARARWTMLLAIGAAALALSLLVMRAGATANALALPGAAWLLGRLLARARAIASPGKRTLATAGALLATTPGLPAGAALAMRLPAAGVPAAPVASPGGFATPCVPARDIPALAGLPIGTVFAPLDITPAVIATTPHRAIAGGYHRNGAAMHRVIATFLASPEAARRAITAAGADYVAACPGANETELFKSFAPDGFWARLERGERFDWLMPVTITRAGIRVWRVIQPSHPIKQRLS